MLSRVRIEALIPHAGSMCLLGNVVRWDATTIACQAPAPTAQHPLAEPQGVPVIVAVEYAAQAAAVHGALLDGAVAPRRGVLGTVRDLELTGCWLGVDGGALDIHAELLGRSSAGGLYAFSVHDAQACRARGRLLVAFS